MEFNFAENGTVAADVFETTVPAKYQGLYVEGEGGRVLSDAAKPLVEEYTGMANTLAGIRVDKKKVTDENAERRIATKAVEDLATSLGLDVGDDGMAAALKLFVDDLQGQVKGGKELKINLDKVNGDWEKRFTELTGSKDAEVEEMRAALSKHLISDAASRALAESKGSIDLLLPHVLSQCKVVRKDDGSYSVTVLDAQGDSRFDGSGGLMGVKGLVEEMKTQEKFGRAFETEQAPGTGSQPGSMNRPAQNQGQKRELTANEKIREGLRKKQYNDGRGSAART
jgi:hypothetical protein